MKTTRLSLLFATLLLVLSCQKEQHDAVYDTGQGALITCTFAINDGVKTTTDDGKTPLWSAGDEIMLYDGASRIKKLTLATSGIPTSYTGVIDGENATKFTFTKPEDWDYVYAIYPYSACVQGFSASAPKLSFAGQDGTFAKANLCAAVEVASSMSFKNIGAILKFPSKPAEVTNIVVPVAGLAKDYRISFSGTAPSLEAVDAENSNNFCIGTGTGPVYIGVPAGTLAKESAFVYRNLSNCILGSYLTGSANTISANKIYTLPSIEADGKIPGMFTVGIDASNPRKVYFASGNLYHEGSAWKFEANQYDFRHYTDYTNDRAMIGGVFKKTPSGTVGSFFWSTSETVACASSYFDAGTTNDVIFTNATENTPKTDFTVNGQTGKWRSLSKAEWNYLLKERTVNGETGVEGTSYQRTTLTLSDGSTTVYGLLIAPDNSDKNLSASTGWFDWQNLESLGFVFIPASGCRYQGEVSQAGLYGYYWSSLVFDKDNAYYLDFTGEVLDVKYNTRNYGFSLRLVRK